MSTFSLYEAKARFSEVIRLVRRGRTVTVTYRGEPVARIQPAEFEASEIGRRVRELEAGGVLQGGGSGQPFGVVARKPGALERFLAERNE
jgi:prevent-host-death family protein